MHAIQEWHSATGGLPAPRHVVLLQPGEAATSSNDVII